MTKITTPLKWAGGKRWLGPRLKKMFAPYHKTHVWYEPFCGGLGATFEVVPETALLCDANPDLINFWNQIKSGVWKILTDPEVREGMNSLVTDSQMTYELLRERFNSEIIGLNSEYRAYAFYLLNRTCFNGLWRVNKAGKMNVPWGRYKKPKLDHDFSVYRPVMAYWEFMNYDFSTVKGNKTTFTYADPPYDDSFTSFTKEGFDAQDQIRLADYLAALPGPVVTSNAKTLFIHNLYEERGFTIETVSARRSISCDGDREDTMEILAYKGLEL